MLKICFSFIRFSVFHSRTTYHIQRERKSGHTWQSFKKVLSSQLIHYTHILYSTVIEKENAREEVLIPQSTFGATKNVPLNFCNADGKPAGLRMLFILVTHWKQELWLRSLAVVSSLHSLRWPIPLVCWRIPAWGLFLVISFTYYMKTEDKIIHLCDKTMFVG